MKYSELLQDFSTEVKKLMDDGFVFYPHSYTNGTLHEHLVKDNILKRVRLDSIREYDHKSWDDGYCLSIDERVLNKEDLIRISNGDSPWYNGDEHYNVTIVNKYYRISYRGERAYSISREEYINCRAIRKSRSDMRDELREIKTQKCFNEKYNKLVLSFIKRQPRCKGTHLEDIERIAKVIDTDRHGKTSVHFKVYAKGKSFTLK